MAPRAFAAWVPLRYAVGHFHRGASEMALHNLSLERTAFGVRSPSRYAAPRSGVRIVEEFSGSAAGQARERFNGTALAQSSFGKADTFTLRSWLVRIKLA